MHQALAEQSSNSAVICFGNTMASVNDVKEIWSYDTKATSKSHKGPESSKSKPKCQPKPPAQQPKFPSYGKSSFKGLLPYPLLMQMFHKNLSSL